MLDCYAVVGNPISHSQSPRIHRLFAQATGQDLDYGAVAAPLAGFAATLDGLRARGFKGVNVTLPFKREACAYATVLGEGARLAGAANALKFDGSSVLAENFDGLGLLRDLAVNLGAQLPGQRILVLGAGGAARGLLLPLLRLRPARLVVANRTLASATALVQEFGSLAEDQAGGHAGSQGVLSGCTFAQLAGQQFEVVLNATSASLSAEALPLPDAVFARCVLAYDLVYGKGLTPFLRQAQALGVAQVCDGVGMLVEQAAEAFFWWRGVRPETAPVIQAITVPLSV